MKTTRTHLKNISARDTSQFPQDQEATTKVYGMNSEEESTPVLRKLAVSHSGCGDFSVPRRCDSVAVPLGTASSPRLADTGKSRATRAGCIFEMGSDSLTNDPRFAWVFGSAEEIRHVAEEAMREYEREVARVRAIPPEERNFRSVLHALETADAKFGDRCGMINLLRNVSPVKAVREAAHLAEEGLEKLGLAVAYDEELYRAVKTVAEKGETLRADERKLLDDTMRSYRRRGFELSPEIRAKLLANKEQLADIARTFDKNISDHHDEIKMAPERTAGLPEKFLEGLARDEAGNYKVSLAYPELGPFMENARDPELRQALSDKNYQKGGRANLELLTAALKLRKENAELLGYATHAHYVIEDRMAETPERVQEFLEDLAAKLRPRADREYAELEECKRRLAIGSANDPNDHALKYYDGAYIAKQLEMERYAFDSEKVREYFPFAHVMRGVMEIYARVLGVKFRKVTEEAPVWHKDVELYTVFDIGSDEPLGHFYLDLYPRPQEGKFSHAAAFTVMNGRTENVSGEEVHAAPLLAMVANFTKPTAKNPALLAHGEVETFFHEFGHLMHGLLTRARFTSQAGTNVKWDFVELPSQMFENWVWDKEMLEKLSAHYETGAPLPDELMDKMLAAKNFLGGRAKLRQYVLANFDLALHTGSPESDIAKFYNELAREYMKVDLPEEAIFPAGFGHLMGYDAGYYSYLWAEVFAHDCFSRFKREGLLNMRTGAEFRRYILSVGSSREEAESLRKFLGREPNNGAFFEELGIK
ncbi:MAG: Zn-dependent oligopeptidase [Candidatus Niyogibacteria bacterium]|nr:Zn-dependent oligopeptidase [Candidatus Niyogibacteria bacterium]